MVGAWGDWWLGHDGRWRQGFPPPGWRRARDGVWHPPGHVPDGAEDAISVSGGIYGTPTTEMPRVASPQHDGPYGTQGFHPGRPGSPEQGERGGPGRHRPARDTRRRLPPFSSWPWLARVTTPAVAALAALAGILIVTEAVRGGSSAPGAAFGRLGPSVSTPLALGPADGTTTTSTASSTSSSAPTTSTTEGASTTPTATTDGSPAPPPSGDTDADVRYQNCNQARALAGAPLLPGDPGYDAALDHNGNGVACDDGDLPGPERP